MAAADKLWFELGVRDEISGVLEKLMRNSEKLAGMLTDDAVEMKNVYKNILDISNVYDKIYVTQKRISELRGAKTLTADEKKGLKEMSKELENVRKEFAAILKNPDRATSRGEAQFEKTRLNIELMLKDTLRYVDNIEAKEAAEAKNAANESRRIDELKAKYYELQRYRKQLSDAIVGAAPGTDTSGSVSIINSISARMSAVKRAERNGSGMPASASGADYEEFLRRVKTEMSGLTSATNDYNSRLETNKQIQSALNKLSADAISQQKIAGIRKQAVEYAALGRKIQEIQNLMHQVSYENGLLAAGRITTPTWTKEKVTEELNAIQRRYNETHAAGKQRELDDAAAMNQRTNAAKKAAEAVGMLAHVNEGLISSYNRIAEAGNKANRISIQIRNQIGTYAGLYGLERILKSVITIGGQFEFQHVALQNILGDIEQANTLYMQLQDLAIESPKTFMELTAYTKQLSAYQIPYKELFDTTKRLADISTGLGVDMQRLILAYGQVRSAAVLRGQELRQFTEAGIPMVQKLSEKFSDLNGRMVTTGEVFELISKRAVPFKMVQEVLWDMTNEGGQFFDMQSKLADTLYGKYQKLQDSWQIMLGRIADGEGVMGSGLKYILELIVSIVSMADTLTPMLSGVAIAKLGKYAISGVGSSIDKASGNTAIKNMQLAKFKEANRLERERVLLGRELTKEEKRLVRTKSELKSEEYYILALEKEISTQKAYQLMQEGKLTKTHFRRLLQLQGYTVEQRKQIMNGNTMLLQQEKSMASKMGNGALSLVGGWWGVAFATIGGIYSLYERASEQAKRASELAGSATGSMLEQLGRVNNIYNSLNKERPKNADEMASAVERMTNALKNSGNYSEEIDKQIQGADSLTEKYRILFGELERVSNEYLIMRDNVQAYIAAANQSGEGNWFTQLFNDNMAEDLADWSKANVAKNVAKKSVDRLSAAMKVQLELFYKEIGAWNEEKMASLDWQSLYDKLTDIGRGNFKNFLNARRQTDFDDEVYESIKKYSNALDALKNKEAEVDTQMQEYADHIEIALNETLKAQGLNPATIAEWDNEGLMKFRDSVNDVLNSYELDGETKERFRDKLYSQLLSEPMIVKVKALPVIEQDALAPWQQDLANYFEKNKIRITVDAQSSLEKVEKDLQNKHKEMQESIERNGKILIKFGFDLSSLPQDIENGLTPLAPEWRSYIGKVLQDYNNDKAEDAKIVQAGKDLGLNINKKSTSGGGNKKDTVLEALKNRVDLYKKFYSELENARKLYGSGATDYLKANGFAEVFGWNLGDVTNYRQSLDKLTKGFNANTEARKKFISSVDADKVSQQRKSDTDAINKLNSELKTQLSMLSEQYDTYKKIYQLTGNQQGAMTIAFGGGVQSLTYKDELIRQMREALAANPQGTLKAEDVFAMDKNAFAKTFGENSKMFSELYEAYAANEKKIKQETLQLMEDAVSKNRTIAQQIEDENRRYERQLELIKQINDPTLRQQAEAGVTQEHNEKVAHLQFEQFKNNSNWVKIFDDLDRVTTETLTDLMTATDKFGHTAGLSVEDVKALQSALAKMREELANRNPFSVMGNALHNMRVLSRAERTHADGDIAGTELAKVLGIDPNSKVTKKQIRDAQKAANSDFSKGVNGLADKFNALANVLDPVIKLFDTLGMSGVGQALSVAQSGFAGAASGAQLFTALGASGPLGAAIGAGLSVVSSGLSALFAAHDNALEEEIQASKRRQEEMKNLTKNLETILTHTLGSVYYTKADEDMVKKMYDLLTHRRGYIEDRTYSQIKEANQSRSYYDAQKASLMVQQDELRHQIESERDKKDGDADKIRDMEQQIKELESEIRYFAEEMAKDLYGIDYKSWASGLADALVSAWENGEDAAEAYKKKVTEILREVGAKVIAQKYLEPLLEKNMEKFISYFESNDGKMDERGLAILAEMYSDADKAAAITTSFLDGMERLANQHGETFKDDGTSNASASIKNITESTADLIASYINAIRADTSANRATLMQLLVIAQTQTEMPVIARAQLVQLEQIARNTKINADAAADIYKLLHNLAPDGQSIKVR
jgi:hypothetical protein